MNDNAFARAWTRMLSVADQLKWLPPLLARASLGTIFITSGWGKLQHLDKVIAFFTNLGIPAARVQAPFVAAVELGCGLAVLFGILTRLAALPLIAVMVVAIITAKRSQIGGGLDLFALEEFLLIVLLAYLHVDGAGKISIDHFWLKDRQ